MKVNRNIIEINEELCNGCGECVVNCAEAALKIVDGKAKLVAEVYCDGLGACLGHCPQGALKVVERPADEFDESAVEELLKQQGKSGHHAPHVCPSTHIQMRSGPTPCETSNRPARFPDKDSMLTHWPVQLRLVGPTAPFIKDADLLIAADCVPVAYAGFHSEMLNGRAVLIGCPKFDNGNEYVQRLKEIFLTAKPKTITVAIMEVPCCQGLDAIVKKALDKSGMRIPLKTIVVGTRGTIS